MPDLIIFLLFAFVALTLVFGGYIVGLWMGYGRGFRDAQSRQRERESEKNLLTPTGLRD